MALPTQLHRRRRVRQRRICVAALRRARTIRGRRPVRAEFMAVFLDGGVGCGGRAATAEPPDRKGDESQSGDGADDDAGDPGF